MIAKGNLHGRGAKLASYLLTGENGEIAQLVEARGLETFGNDPVSAFATLQKIAEAHTRSTLPFFHTQTRAAPGEHLSDAQWMEVADREEKRLGFKGQPRIVSYHIDPASGEKHMHVAWFRVDLETMRAIDPGLFKNHLKQLARDIERDFGLRQVGNGREAGDRARIADRDEVEESRRLGTDVRAIRTSILDSYEQSDSGKAFKAALEAKGLVLANGDRRDCFVVVDPEGGHHALTKKLTGQTLAATRERLADLDRSQLPSVDQAKTLQAERLQAQEAQKQTHRQVALGQGRETSARRERGSQAPEKPPLGRTAAHIHAAWTETRNPADLAASAKAFHQAIEDRGPILVYVTAEEARASQRAQSFAKAVGRQNRALKEGFAVVDERGTVTRIDPRVTGDLSREIERRLASIDRTKLSTVAEARDVMKKANRAAGADAREQTRLMSYVEARGAGGRPDKQGPGQTLRSTTRLAKTMGRLLGGLFGFLVAEPKLTPQQVRDRVRAESNEEVRHARAVDAATQETEEARDEQRFRQAKTQQEQDLSLGLRHGRPVTREANIGRERDEGDERER